MMRDINFYLSGGDSANTTQYVNLLSLGNYISSTALETLKPHRTNPIGGIRIRYISPQCGAGLAKLTSTIGNKIKFSAPGDQYGEEIKINPHEKNKKIYSNDKKKYIIVDNTVEQFLGNEIFQILPTVNNAISGSNITTDETTSGIDKYRCIFLKNESEETLSGCKLWVYDSTSTAIAIETPSSGQVQSIADETTAPIGLSFSSPEDYGSGVTLSNIAAGGMMGIWIRTSFPPLYDTPDPSKKIEIYCGTSETNYITLSGILRVAGDGVAGYYLWWDRDADVTSVSHDEFFETLPQSYPVSPDTTIFPKIIKKNSHGMMSAPWIGTRLTVDSTGLVELQPPSSLSDLQTTNYENKIKITGYYNSGIDEFPEDKRATDYYIWYGINETPTTSGSPDVIVNIDYSGTNKIKFLEHLLEDSNILEGDTIYITACTARDDTRSLTYSSSSVDVVTSYPTRTYGVAGTTGTRESDHIIYDSEDSTSSIDSTYGINFDFSGGINKLYIDTVLCFGITDQHIYIPSEYTISDTDSFDSTGVDTVNNNIEIISWTPNDRVVRIGNSIEIDIDNHTMTIVQITDQSNKSGMNDNLKLSKNTRNDFKIFSWDKYLSDFVSAINFGEEKTTISGYYIDDSLSSVEIEGL